MLVDEAGAMTDEACELIGGAGVVGWPPKVEVSATETEEVMVPAAEDVMAPATDDLVVGPATSDACSVECESSGDEATAAPTAPGT